MKSLYIGIISQEYPPYTSWGGAAIYYQQLVHSINQQGHHKVTIISRYSQGAPKIEYISDFINIFRVGYSIKRKKIIGRTLDKIFHARDVFKIIKKIDAKEPFDIIEVPEYNLEGYYLTKDPYFNKKISIQCHGSNAIGVIPNGIFSFLHRLDHLWSLKYELTILRNAKKITVPSKSGYQFLVQQGITNDKITIIYHGIDTIVFNSSRNKWQCPPLEVGFIGKLHKMKGLDFIWKVMEKIGPDSNIKFHLFGTMHPSEKQEINEYLKKYSNFTTYHYPVDHSEMPRIYQSLHVLLQPSRFEEFGFVYAEAMACELVVFAGLEGGGSEIVQNNTTGFHVNPDGNVDWVVEKLKEIVINPTSFNKMRHNARKSIMQNFSQEASIANKMEYYYKF